MQILGASNLKKWWHKFSSKVLLNHCKKYSVQCVQQDGVIKIVPVELQTVKNNYSIAVCFMHLNNISSVLHKYVTFTFHTVHVFVAYCFYQYTNFSTSTKH